MPPDAKGPSVSLFPHSRVAPELASPLGDVPPAALMKAVSDAGKVSPSLVVVIPLVAGGSAALVTAGFHLSRPLLLARLLLPLLACLPAWPMMALLLLRGRRLAAFGVMLCWAAALTTTMVLLTVSEPAQAERIILHGREYWQEMEGWVMTGIGKEASPALFLPEHLRNAAVFVLLSLLTAGALSLLMGACLMDYMSYYVGRVALQSRHPFLTALLAWHPYSVVRVAAFVGLGVILAEPLLWTLARRRWSWRRLLLPGGLALCGLLLDIVLKALLAPVWPELMRASF